MTARERLVSLQRVLLLVVVLRALLIGAGVALGGVAVARVVVLPPGAILLVTSLGAFVAVLLAARGWGARSLTRVALWVEERHPALRYALVTATEGATVPEVEVQALAVPWWKAERRTLGRALVGPAVGLLAAITLLVLSQRIAPSGVLAPGATAPMTAPGGAARTADPLASLRVTVRAPAYSGRGTVTLDDPTSVDALVGSSVIVSGSGSAVLVTGSLDSAALPAVTRDDRWSLSTTMPSKPALLRLRSRLEGGRERLVVLAPIADAPPAVTLLAPTRDTTVRTAAGALVLRAQLRDDIGLRDASFEIIVSSGQEESFTFRSAVLARTSLGGRRDGELAARLSLDSLALKPGDIVQMRAVARDANDVTGPGVGSSETRALRVARAGEYDSVAVEAAPPSDPDGQVLSQRMLITLTEALERRRRTVGRSTLLTESRRIAADQARLRKRVGDVVFQRTGGEPLSEEGEAGIPEGKLTPEQLLERARAAGTDAGSPMDVEGDETPILALNKPLLEAYNAMWDAGRALEQAEPAQALPPMRRALAAIERARQAERIYLRGRPSAVIVDVAHARLAGKEKGSTATLAQRYTADPVARRRAESFARASALLAADRDAAADSLLVMRVGALGDAPALAAVLDTAARVTRRGSPDEVALAWARVRRALGGAPVRRDSLPAWSGAP
ncbi:MAG TPA: hypothetical protein VFY85_02995 [Gemmatimonadaceae bacterium]|nr:hypothetical protein [Gemmatimonadaceae bacterium]